MDRHRAWCYTLNNYTENEHAGLKEIACVYHVIGQEVGAGGTPHLQGFVYFAHGKTFNAVKKLIGARAHLEPKSPYSTFLQAMNYCKKDLLFWEKGELPLDQQEKGKKEKERYADAWTAATTGQLDMIDADIRIRHYHTIKRICEDARDKPVALPERPYYGVWIHGPPRTGKSHSVRTLGVEVYMKDINKWWCGYKGEDIVLIDEIGPKHDFMADSIKKWVDRWPFSAETKGGKVVLRPKWFVVTSNYRIEDCFQSTDQLAILERFLVLEKTHKEVDLGLSNVLHLSPDGDVLDLGENPDFDVAGGLGGIHGEVEERLLDWQSSWGTLEESVVE